MKHHHGNKTMFVIYSTVFSLEKMNENDGFFTGPGRSSQVLPRHKVKARWLNTHPIDSGEYPIISCRCDDPLFFLCLFIPLISYLYIYIIIYIYLGLPKGLLF